MKLYFSGKFMKKWQKIVGVIFGAIFILFLIAQYIIGTKMWFSVKQHRESEKSELVARIDIYVNKNGGLPASLSELGFEQTPGLYCYKGNSLNLIRTDHSNNEYILEWWDRTHKIWQYVSEDKKWYDYELWEFEPPINIDTIGGINKVYYSPKDNMQCFFDSLRINDNITSILDFDTEVTPDSIAYVRYYTADTLNMEGWATYRANSRPDYVKEFGEWKYYDGEGNCYRKFWNYKKNGKLIYETDR